jgi:hypothetical protein
LLRSGPTRVLNHAARQSQPGRHARRVAPGLRPTNQRPSFVEGLAPSLAGTQKPAALSAGRLAAWAVDRLRRRARGSLHAADAPLAPPPPRGRYPSVPDAPAVC